MMTVELRRKMHQMQGMAMSNALTRLPNHAAFMMAVEQAISRLQRHNERFTMAYLDLDGFKAINDGFGHAEGDRGLQSTTLVIKQHVRREDDLGRIGGDEFGLLAAADDAGFATATRLCGELSAYLSLRGLASDMFDRRGVLHGSTSERRVPTHGRRSGHVCRKESGKEPGHRGELAACLMDIAAAGVPKQ